MTREGAKEAIAIYEKLDRIQAQIKTLQGTKSWRVQFRQGFKTAAEAMEWADAAVLDEAAKPAPGGPKMREGWQPIAKLTAGHGFVLVIGPSGYSCTPYRVAVCAYRPPFRPGTPLVNHAGDAFTDGGAPATHWMPLPAPPEPTVPEVPARVDGEGE